MPDSGHQAGDQRGRQKHLRHQQTHQARREQRGTDVLGGPVGPRRPDDDREHREGENPGEQPGDQEAASGAEPLTRRKRTLLSRRWSHRGGIRRSGAGMLAGGAESVPP